MQFLSVYNGKTASVGGLQGVFMNDDQMYRAVASAAGVLIYAWLIQKAKAYLGAKRDQTGRGLAERVGYRLGQLWPRRNRTR